MNCQEVEAIIRDLARGDEANQQALAHVKRCPRCSERLSEEETLTTGLAAWAEASSSEQAAPMVEAKLREAFRRNAAPARRRWIPVAAAGSIAAALVLAKLFTPAAHPIAQVAPPVVKAVAVSNAPPVVAAAPMEEIRSPRRAVRHVAREVRRPPAPPAELDFLPVPQGDGWTPLDGGRMVRVGLPRTALRAFGLPINEERASEQVQADVMLSNDGLLRAIRFVK